MRHRGIDRDQYNKRNVFYMYKYIYFLNKQKTIRDSHIWHSNKITFCVLGKACEHSFILVKLNIILWCHMTTEWCIKSNIFFQNLTFIAQKKCPKCTWIISSYHLSLLRSLSPSLALSLFRLRKGTSDTKRKIKYFIFIAMQ